MKLKIGKTYTRRQIHDIVGGGSVQSYLPMKDGRVLCGCFDPDLNPMAPREVDVGDGAMREKSARTLANDRNSIPVFLKEASGVWRFEGMYRAVRYSTTAVDLKTSYRRPDAVGVLYMVPVDETVQPPEEARRRYFTCYWRSRTIRDIADRDGEFLDYAAGTGFAHRGVHVGDVVFCVNIEAGRLRLLGAFEVARICSKKDAAVELGCEPEDLWDAAEHLIASKATPMHFSSYVPVEVTQSLRFEGAAKVLKFREDDYLDEQTLREIRTLTESSAQTLLSLLPPLRSTVHVFRSPEEPDPRGAFFEGDVVEALVYTYERDPAARKACLEHYGYACVVCDMRFADRYGEIGREFIHVHHRKPLSSVGKRYKIDPIKHLLPVCPNCHAMLHTATPPLEIEVLRGILDELREKSDDFEV